jgi:hypothetical protein
MPVHGREPCTDGAIARQDLIAHVEVRESNTRGGNMAARKATPKHQSPQVARQTATSASRLNRGPVDAPGKHHRKPLPQEPINRRMGEPRGKQMGQKTVKSGWRSGRS